MIAKVRTWWLNTQERLLEVRANPFRFGHNSLATGTQKKSVWRVELDDAVDVGVRKCFGSFLQDLKRFLFRPSDGG